MFSSVISSISPSTQYALGGSVKAQQAYATPAPSRFSVRVFKGATPSFSYTSVPKFDAGYRPTSHVETQPGSNWYPSRYEDTSKRFSTHVEAPKLSRVASSTNPSASNRTFEAQRPRTSNNYSIYPNVSNGTYIYEQSLCSKSDLYSTSELDSVSNATFSPAMSTDSTLTLKSPGPSESFLDSQYPSRSSSPVSRPSFSTQGAQYAPPQSINRSLSSNQARRNDQPNTTNQDHHPGLASHTNSTSPIRLSTTISGSTEHTNSRMSFTPSSFVGFDDPQRYASSVTTESVLDEREMIARANAGFNAVSSSGFSSPSDRDIHSIALSRSESRASVMPMSSTATEVNGRPGFSQPTYTTTFVENSPEQLEDLRISRHPSDPPLHISSRTVTMSNGQFIHPISSESNISEDRLSLESEQFIPAFGRLDWEDDARMALQQIPVNQNDITDQRQNYIPNPASRSNHISTLYSDRDRRQERPLPVPPPSISRQRSAHTEYRSSVVGPRPEATVTRTSPGAQDHPQPRNFDDGRNEPSRRNSGDRPMSSAYHEEYSEKRRDDQGVFGLPKDAFKGPPPSGFERPVARGRESRPTSPVDSPDRNHDSSRSKRDARGNTGEQFTNSNFASHRQSGLFSAHRSPATGVPVPENGNPLSFSFSQQTLTHPPNLYPTAATSGGEIQGSRIRRDSLSAPRSFRTGDRPPQSYPPHEVAVVPSQAPLKPTIPTDPKRPRSSSLSPKAVEATEAELRRDVRISPPRETLPPSRPSAPHINSTAPQNNPTNTPNARIRPSPVQEPQRRRSDGDRPPNVPAPYPVGASVPHEPHRRYSDGDQTVVPSAAAASGRNSAPLTRTVRWTENLICPSPIFACHRRKGWYNRRGDQLWTNDGAYKPAPAGQEYPPDLDEYPERGEGWMNEECVRINMEHRLIPKPPLRSALKQSKP